MHNNIFILSGPAAVGKTTVSKLVMQKFPQLQKTMTFTTREKRNSGTEDKIMKYISKSEFETKINNNDFIEWAFVHGNYYGTDKKYLENTLKKSNLIMNIDVQGGLQMKKLYPETVLIFIKPESFTQLKNRLIKRQKPLPEIPQSRNKKLTEDADPRNKKLTKDADPRNKKLTEDSHPRDLAKNKDLETRLKNVKKELKLGQKYDHKIINEEGKINQTVQNISKIINQHLSID